MIKQLQSKHPKLLLILGGKKLNNNYANEVNDKFSLIVLSDQQRLSQENNVLILC